MTDTVADLGFTIPDDPDGIQEILMDAKKFGKVHAAGPAAMSDLMGAYAKAADKRMGEEIAEQVAVQKQQIKAEMLADAGIDPDRPGFEQAKPVAGGAAPQRFNPQQSADFHQHYNPHAVGAKADELFMSGQGFDTAGYLQAIHHQTRDQDSLAQRNKLDEIKNAYGSTVGADGGFLIPEQLRAELLSVALATAVVRPRARVLPMANPRVPIPSIDETTRVGQVFGGIVGYWTEEGAAATISSASFGQVALEAKKLTGYTEIPNETIADAILFGAFFDETFPQAISHFEDLAFTSGTGVGEPLGFRSAGSMVTVAKEGSQTADTVVWENVVKMYSRMLPASIGNAVWVINADVFPQLALMETSAGAGGLWIGPNMAPGAPPTSLLGLPVVTSDKVPVVGDVGDINLVDFSYYLVGDRQEMTATSSEHFKFSTGKTSFLITERVDGRPWLDTAITPPVGQTLSPFVDLAARA